MILKFLIRHLTKYSYLALLRNIIFDKYHYKTPFIISIKKYYKKKKYKKAYKRAVELYESIEKDPYFNNTILVYTSKESKGTVRAILKDTLIYIYTKEY